MKKNTSLIKNSRPPAPKRQHGMLRPMHSRLHEQVRLYHSKLALIDKSNHTLAEAQTRLDLYNRLARLIYSVLPRVHLFYLFRVNPISGLISCVYAAQGRHHLPQPFDPAAHVSPAGSNLIQQVVQLRRPLVMPIPARPVGQGRQAQSVLITPMLHKGQVDGVLEIISTSNLHFGTLETDLMALLGNSAAIKLENIRMQGELTQATQQLNHAHAAAVEAWRRALELRDRATENHGNRVADMTVRLAVTLGFAPMELTHLRFGAQLHDIGKIGVPDSVLLKPGPLDEGDLKIMREHPAYAYDMLHSIPNFQPILDIPYSHHERWDGNGYPRGLRGEQIPFPARIFAVIDVWDALRSDRPYRDAWPEPQVIHYIRDQSGKQFDPRVVEAFLRMMILPRN